MAVEETRFLTVFQGNLWKTEVSRNSNWRREQAYYIKEVEATAYERGSTESA